MCRFIYIVNVHELPCATSILDCMHILLYKIRAHCILLNVSYSQYITLYIIIHHVYTGTTIDAFLREHLDWLGKATNWAKFTAVASIGVVHKV